VTRPASAGLQNYRSKAIALEVRLREQLAETGAGGYNRLRAALASGDSFDSMQMVPRERMTRAKLQVYSDLFDAVIECDETYGHVLEKVKTIYDACAEPHLKPASVEHVNMPAVPSKSRLERLMLENQVLKATAGRLYNDIHRRDAGGSAAQGESHFLRGLHDDADSQDSIATERIPSMPFVPAAAARPFSAMRVTSTGVRMESW